MSRPADLTVRVQFISESALWAWEIIGRPDECVVESSWASEWLGYPSPEQALAAGVQRATMLTKG